MYNFHVITYHIGALLEDSCDSKGHEWCKYSIHRIKEAQKEYIW